MSASAWPVVALLVVAAAVIGWPSGGGRSRRRALLDPDRAGGGTTVASRPARLATVHLPRSGWRGPLRSNARSASAGPPGRRDPTRPANVGDGPLSVDVLPSPLGPGGPAQPGGRLHERRQVRGVEGGATSGAVPEGFVLGRLTSWSAAPGRSTALVASLGALLGAVLAGPVAAVTVAAYAALGARALLRRTTIRAAERLRRGRLDQLGALAAELRAGLPVPPALTGASPSPDDARRPDGARSAQGARSPDRSATGWSNGRPRDPDRRSPDSAPAHLAGLDRIDRLTRAGACLADRTGAPLAELLERIEADLRATDRGRAAAAAQAAGARATAWLLAALPLGGIALGYGIGVDPTQVLFHTPVGAGCAVGATILQTVGLLWAERLSAAPGGVH